MQERIKAEILAPVGSHDMLIAAVRSGADAVYLGAKDFSARKNAENFDYDELKSAIEYCHIRGVKVYLTLNTLIKQSELQSAFLLAKDAYNLGIDGIIVQDLGLAGIIGQKLPELELHASTQMSVHSPTALPVLKKLGFCRVVAAREMSRSELKALCEKARELDMTVEVFVHGALCMSVSGQCLLSAFLGSRSGNRGLCAGPCRLPFKAKGGTGYDLSLKDLSLIEYLNELALMGVYSFKIEGRMKRPEYVAAATSVCREALDLGTVSQEKLKLLTDVFSRSGFTDGYYKNRLGRDMFGIRTKDDVLSSGTVLTSLHEIYRKERQSVPITVEAVIKRGVPVSVTLFDGFNAAVATGNTPQEAQRAELTEESVLKNVCKLGATAYFCKNAFADIDSGLFVSAGELNRLRRDACETLDLKRAENMNKKSTAEYYPDRGCGKAYCAPRIFARFENLEQIPEDLGNISAIIYPLEKNPDKLANFDVKLIADIPRGISNEDIIKERLSLFYEKGFKSALCGNLAAVEIAKNAGFEIIADVGLNLINAESLKISNLLGVKSAIISPEELISDISSLPSPIPKGIIAYGNIPLMIFRNCPLKNGISCNECDQNGVLTDRFGFEFPVRCRMGYSELLNSQPIWLADKIEQLSCVNFLVLYFTRETKDEVSNVINAYKNGLSCNRDFTRGLYFRGVK